MKELPTMQELQSFITYNKTGSFTLAAQSMNITQSAFSAQMKKLERLVGVKLISRSTRGPEAEQVLDTLERAIQSIRLASKVERPILNIGVLRSLGDIRLNGYVSHFFQNHPEFSVSIYDMEEEELMLDLRENRIDIALLYLPNNKDMSAYESTALREDEFVYYAPNIIDGMEVASLKAIQQQPLLMYPPKYFMYRTLKNYVGNGQQNLHIRGSRLSNPYTMIDYCQKNKSGCIVARQILNSLNINDGYIPLEKPFKLQVCFAFKKNNSKSETMHTFMDYVHSESPARL
ncbi:MAG: LysR family transcriptional regulator [Veillonella sp.]|nr:LysR family transcriptional regulator [Veillonella sp.]